MLGPVREVGAPRSQRGGRRSRFARSGTPEPAGTPLPAHPRSVGPVTCARTRIGRVLLRNAANHWISMRGIIPCQGTFASVSTGHRNALLRLHTAEVTGSIPAAPTTRNRRVSRVHSCLSVFFRVVFCPRVWSGRVDGPRGAHRAGVALGSCLVWWVGFSSGSRWVRGVPFLRREGSDRRGVEIEPLRRRVRFRPRRRCSRGLHRLRGVGCCGSTL